MESTVLSQEYLLACSQPNERKFSVRLASFGGVRKDIQYSLTLSTVMKYVFSPNNNIENNKSAALNLRDPPYSVRVPGKVSVHTTWKRVIIL